MSVSFVSGAASVRSRFPLSALAVACGLCSMTALQAAEEHVHELPPSVITAIQQSSPLTVVADPKDARQPVPASDAADYLKTIPGFSAIRSGGSNSDPVLRGLFGSRLLLLTDGGQMIGACPGRMDAPSSYISPETFDLLTVTKGPQTVIWDQALRRAWCVSSVSRSVSASWARVCMPVCWRAPTAVSIKCWMAPSAASRATCG